MPHYTPDGMADKNAELANEIQDYADSLDEFVTIDDVYASLTTLANEVRQGQWGWIQ